jgi:hypothetical protein
MTPVVHDNPTNLSPLYTQRPRPSLGLPRADRYKVDEGSTRGSYYTYGFRTPHRPSGLPKFHGHGDYLSPIDFLDKFKRRVLEVSNVTLDDALHLWLQSCLRDEAAVWFEFMTRKSKILSNWNKFKCEFMNEYAPGYENQLRKEFLNRTQHIEELLTAFITKLDRYIDILYPEVSEEGRIQLILDRLHPKLKIYMKTRVFNNVAQMCRYAQEIQHDLARSRDY